MTVGPQWYGVVGGSALSILVIRYSMTLVGHKYIVKIYYKIIYYNIKYNHIRRDVCMVGRRLVNKKETRTRRRSIPFEYNNVLSPRGTCVVVPSRLPLIATAAAAASIDEAAAARQSCS